MSEKTLKLCALCGKDLSLEDSRTDEHGSEVHMSCYAGKMLLKAVSEQLEALRTAKSA